MNNTFRVQVVRRGVITLPKELREHNHIEEGDTLTLIDLGEGVVVMSPRRSRVDEIADKLAKEWQGSGESLESMLTTLREVRAGYASTGWAFLDTSVIFAAVLSPSGGGRKLFYLAEAGLLRLVIGPNVLRECEQVVKHKAPSLPLLAQLLAVGQVENAATRRQIATVRLIVAYAPDARVLAEAIKAKPDWFITHDKTHFLNSQNKETVAFRIGTPGDLLQILQDGLTEP